MTNREKLNSTCIYDLLMSIEKNVGICPIQAVIGISKEEKIRRCFRNVQGGCEQCVQGWLNEEFSTENSH